MQHLIILTETDRPLVFVNTTSELETIRSALNKDPLALNKRWQIYTFQPAPTKPNGFGGIELACVGQDSHRTPFEMYLQRALYYAKIHGDTTTQIAEAIVWLTDELNRAKEVKKKIQSTPTGS